MKMSSADEGVDTEFAVKPTRLVFHDRFRVRDEQTAG